MTKVEDQINDIIVNMIGISTSTKESKAWAEEESKKRAYREGGTTETRIAEPDEQDQAGTPGRADRPLYQIQAGKGVYRNHGG